MQTKVISINRSLRELKTLDARIDKKSRNNKFVSLAKNTATSLGGVTREEYEKVLVANFNEVRDLLTYRKALKSVVIASNARTKITVNEQEMTIAEAIYLKDAIEEEQQLLLQVARQRATNISTIEMNNAQLEKKFEAYITGMYGGKDKIDSTELEAARVMYYNNNGTSLIDPNKTDVWVKEEEARQVAFLDEIDGSITDSNAVTNVTVEW